MVKLILDKFKNQIDINLQAEVEDENDSQTV